MSGLGALTAPTGFGIGGRLGPATAGAISSFSYYRCGNLLSASSCAPVIGAPPQIQEATPQVAVNGTGGGGAACFEVAGSTRGVKGFR